LLVFIVFRFKYVLSLPVSFGENLIIVEELNNCINLVYNAEHKDLS